MYEPSGDHLALIDQWNDNASVMPRNVALPVGRLHQAATEYYQSIIDHIDLFSAFLKKSHQHQLEQLSTYFDNLEASREFSKQLLSHGYESWSEFHSLVGRYLSIPDAAPGPDSFLFSWTVGRRELRLEAFGDGDALLFHRIRGENHFLSVEYQIGSLDESVEARKFIRAIIMPFRVV